MHIAQINMLTFCKFNKRPFLNTEFQVFSLANYYIAYYEEVQSKPIKHCASSYSVTFIKRLITALHSFP